MTRSIDLIPIITITLFALDLGGVMVYERSRSNTTKESVSWFNTWFSVAHFGSTNLTEIHLKDLLKQIKDKNNVISIVNEFYSHDFNEIGSMRTKINDVKNFSDKSRITLTNLFSFLFDACPQMLIH